MYFQYFKKVDIFYHTFGYNLAPILDNFFNQDGIGRMWTLPGPSACGEQTISGVAPPIMAVHYLKKNNTLTEAHKQKARKLITPGFERQLRYR